MSEYTSVNHARDLAQLLYTSHHKTIKEICLATDSTEAQIRDYIQKGNWEAHRRTLTATKQVQLEILYDILAEQTAKIKEHLAGKKKEDITSKDADLVLKYTTAIKNLEKDTSVRELIDAGKLFITWVIKKDHSLGQHINQHWDDFIHERLSQSAE